MWFYIFMFICNLLIPSAMLIAGHCMVTCPPENRNGYMGYRSGLAKKNKDTWLFAHDYCGKLWKKLGAALLILTVIVQLPFLHSNDTVIGIMTVALVGVQIAVILGSVVSVEKALKKAFDSNGVRK